jgi:drug/metabolite transporter (DMT)-like permease
MKHIATTFAETDARPTDLTPARTLREEDIGLLLGLIGVVIFAATLPLTRLAVPALGAPFLTAGRALIAGLIALPVLAAGRRAPPWRRMPRLGLAALSLAAGFPGFSSLAMRSLPAAHAAVVVGVLPLATALAAALIGRERPSPAFWACAILGAALIGGFALYRGGGALQPGDALLLLAIAAAAFGYALAGQLSREMPARDVISWIVVLALPVSAPLTWAFAPSQPASVPTSAWACLAYLGIMSMYLGFFAWNAGLARGGVARVAQTQLAQPFITIALSAPLLGERIDAETVLCATLVVALVFIGRRRAIPTRPEIAPMERRDRWRSNPLWRLAGWPFRVAAARRAMGDLAGMSARELADIGLSRQDLRDASPLPLGDDPTRILVMRVAERARR